MVEETEAGKGFFKKKLRFYFGYLQFELPIRPGGDAK